MTKEDYIAMQNKMERFDELEKQFAQVVDVSRCLNSPKFDHAYLTVQSDLGDHEYFDIPIEMLGDLKSLLKMHQERIATKMEEL